MDMHGALHFKGTLNYIVLYLPIPSRILACVVFELEYYTPETITLGKQLISLWFFMGVLVLYSMFSNKSLKTEVRQT